MWEVKERAMSLYVRPGVTFAAVLAQTTRRPGVSESLARGQENNSSAEEPRHSLERIGADYSTPPPRGNKRREVISPEQNRQTQSKVEQPGKRSKTNGGIERSESGASLDKFRSQTGEETVAQLQPPECRGSVVQERTVKDGGKTEVEDPGEAVALEERQEQTSESGMSGSQHEGKQRVEGKEKQHRVKGGGAGERSGEKSKGSRASKPSRPYSTRWQ